MTYIIKLDTDSINIINHFAGFRYVWSDILSSYNPIINEDGSMQIEINEVHVLELYNGMLNHDTFLFGLSPNSLLYQEVYRLVNYYVGSNIL